VLELRAGNVVLRSIHDGELDVLYEERKRSPFRVGEPDRDALRQRIEHSGDWREGLLDLAVEVDGRLIGTVGARTSGRFWPPGVCEIGIELFEAERGKGYGSEAVRVFAEWLLEHGYPRVQATTDVANTPMRRVFEKLGWRFEGVLHAFMPMDSGRADYALYALTSD